MKCGFYCLYIHTEKERYQSHTIRTGQFSANLARGQNKKRKYIWKERILYIFTMNSQFNFDLCFLHEAILHPFPPNWFYQDAPAPLS